MENRRWAIVAGLGVVEIWIVGLIVRSLAGDGHGYPTAATIAAPPSSYAPSPARDGTPLRIIDAGAAPSVVIDDNDAAGLTVTVRSGARVSVIDRTQCSGWLHTDKRPVSVERTADGVRISRQSGGFTTMFGSLSRQLEVIVPPQARLDVRNAGSIRVAGLRADARFHSDDGTIAVSDHRGALVVTADNGRIELSDIDAPSVETTSDDGRISFDRVRADRVVVKAENGRIEIGRSVLRSGDITTDNGRVALSLDPQSNVTLRARAESGEVIARSPLTLTPAGEADDAPKLVRVGNGSGRLDVGSGDGSISIQAGRV